MWHQDERDPDYWLSDEEIRERRQRIFDQTGIRISDALPEADGLHWEPMEFVTVKPD